MKQATIKGITRKRSVSLPSVSMALSGYPDICEDTRLRVEFPARELECHPNTLTKSLQHKRTQVLGVVIPQEKHCFFASIMTGIANAGYQAGFKMKTELIDLKSANKEKPVSLSFSI
jgi:DNA-binding LacI/PurR family transcriptional regulator